MRLSWKKQTQSLKELNQTFYGSLVIIDIREIFQGANPLEAHLQFNDGHNDDHTTFQNSN